MPFYFEYALYSPSADAWYTGRAGEHWIGPKRDAYTYTAAGAYRKAELFNRGAFSIRDWRVCRIL